MTNLLSFNFHNLVGLNVVSNDPFATRFFKLENQFSTGDFPRDLGLVNLHWERRRPTDGRKINYRSQFHKLLARWSYWIEITDKGIEIDAFGNRTAVPMVHHMLVHPSLRYLCARQKVMMMHGSAVVLGNKSVVFTGMGGTGKTTISSLILKHGGVDWKLHADDYVFLSTRPFSYAYITRAHLYRDQIRWIPFMKEFLTPGERLHLEFFGRLREISRDGLKWPLRITATRLWPEHVIAPKANLAAIILLKRGSDTHPILQKVSRNSEIVDSLIQMNFHEARHFIRLFETTLDLHDREKWLKEWKIAERGILEEILKKTALYELYLPHRRDVPKNYGEQLVEIVTPLCVSDATEVADGNH